MSTRAMSAATLTVFEYELQKLPGCRECHAPHPRAKNPDDRSTDCTHCGAHLPPLPRPRLVDASFAGKGLRASLARACLAVGKWLLDLSQKKD